MRKKKHHKTQTGLQPWTIIGALGKCVNHCATAANHSPTYLLCYSSGSLSIYSKKEHNLKVKKKPKLNPTLT